MRILAVLVLRSHIYAFLRCLPAYPPPPPPACRARLKPAIISDLTPTLTSTNRAPLHTTSALRAVTLNIIHGSDVLRAVPSIRDIPTTEDLVESLIQAAKFVVGVCSRNTDDTAKAMYARWHPLTEHKADLWQVAELAIAGSGGGVFGGCDDRERIPS